MTGLAAQVSNALTDFNDGFADGWNARTRKRNRGAQYLRTYNRAVVLRRIQDAGGEDLGNFGRSGSSRKRS